MRKICGGGIYGGQCWMNKLSYFRFSHTLRLRYDIISLIAQNTNDDETEDKNLPPRVPYKAANNFLFSCLHLTPCILDPARALPRLELLSLHNTLGRDSHYDQVTIC